jgi:hypothetical protein
MATTVVGAFDEFRSRLALTDAQKATALAHIKSIESFFESNFELDASTGFFYTGSFRRGTMLRWTRDVDIMASLSVSKYDPVYGDDSSKFLYMVRDALNQRFSSTTVSSKRVAIKLDFTNIAADVVPCFRREGGGFFMPDGSGNWRATYPGFHTTLMREADEAKSNRLKPLVKLLKAWNIANGHHLSSIHVELMVERMWQTDSFISSPYPAAVAETLRVMPGWAVAPFADPWSDGRRIDADLSSADRDMAVRMLRKDAKNSANAEQYRASGQTEKAFEKWDSVFRNRFPAYG